MVLPIDHNPKLHVSVFSLLIFNFNHNKNKKLLYSLYILIHTPYKLSVKSYFINLIRLLNRVDLLDSRGTQSIIYYCRIRIQHVLLRIDLTIPIPI